MLRTGFEYFTQLQLMINQLEKSVNDILYPVIKANKPDYIADAWADDIQATIDQLLQRWDSPLFRAYARRLSDSFVLSSLKFSERTQKRSFGIDIFQNSTELTDYLRAASIQNTNLILSIPRKHLENVSNIVFSTMRNGVMPTNIAEQLQREVGVTRRRAKFIARDQAAKVNGEINKQRQKDAGFEFFKWNDAHDQRVRHRHREIAEADVGYGVGVYRWDDLPKSSDGQTIQPGSDYQCRCTAKPVRNSTVKKYLEQHGK